MLAVNRPEYTVEDRQVLAEASHFHGVAQQIRVGPDHIGAEGQSGDKGEAKQLFHEGEDQPEQDGGADAEYDERSIVQGYGPAGSIE